MSQEMMLLLSFVGLHTIWVILPLIPAVIIYRLFPNTTVAVNGPLANLTVRASGAFAAYLIVFAATYFFIVKQTEEVIVAFQHPFWTIKGHIELVDKEGKKVTAESLLDKMRVRTDPDQFKVQSYRVQLNIPEIQGGDLPGVIFEIPAWGRQEIDLRSASEVSIDRFHKVIELKNPIMIKDISVGVSPVVRPQRTEEVSPPSPR
jgi:hypothetical protein